MYENVCAVLSDITTAPDGVTGQGLSRDPQVFPLFIHV